jgi:hypothetical protein
MDFNDLTPTQILDTLTAECAKALNEVRHAEDDLDKADSRLKFVLALIHNLKERDLKE